VVETLESLTPVAWLSATTLAPGTMAPEESVTRPLMDPLPACANAKELKVISKQMRKMDRNPAVLAHRISMATPGVKRLIQTFESLDDRE
jgi:hypothetical protein